MKTSNLIIYFLSVYSSFCLANDPTSFLYAHGIAHNQEQAYWYVKKTPDGKENKHYLIDGRLFTFNFPDATKAFWRVNFLHTSLGQANELTSLYKAYNQSISLLVEDNESPNLVLMGLSRGASAGLIFLGLFKTGYIKAAVFESPFDTHSNLVKSILKKIHLDAVPGMHTVGSWLMQLIFMQHKKDGICPLDAVEFIPKNKPILLICSKEDTTVPYTNTLELYKKLLQTGHTDVYILILDKGKHSKLLNDLQGKLYQNTVHAFYKRYNLSHNPLFAAQGEEALNCCKLTLEMLLNV